MALNTSTRLGSYEIAAPIGVGGMGEVHRATDTKLGGDVAVKVLPEAFTADPDHLARLEREAKVLASLNHPNAAPRILRGKWWTTFRRKTRAKALRRPGNLRPAFHENRLMVETGISAVIP